MQGNEVGRLGSFEFPLYCMFTGTVAGCHPFHVQCERRAWAVFRTSELAFEHIRSTVGNHFALMVALAEDAKTFHRELSDRVMEIHYVVFDYRADANGRQASGDVLSTSELLRLLTNM